MVRALIALIAMTVASPVLAEGASVKNNRNRDDSFLYAAPARNGARVPNYVVDSARGHTLDYNERRRIDRPSLSGEGAGLKLQTR